MSTFSCVRKLPRFYLIIAFTVLFGQIELGESAKGRELQKMPSIPEDETIVVAHDNIDIAGIEQQQKEEEEQAAEEWTNLHSDIHEISQTNTDMESLRKCKKLVAKGVLTKMEKDIQKLLDHYQGLKATTPRAFSEYLKSQKDIPESSKNGYKVEKMMNNFLKKWYSDGEYETLMVTYLICMERQDKFKGKMPMKRVKFVPNILH
jgi:hypothetical protein